MHQAIKGRQAATSLAKPLASFETSFTCLNGKGAKGQRGERAKGRKGKGAKGQKGKRAKGQREIKHLLASI
jgi:hypothetical protein